MTGRCRFREPTTGLRLSIRSRRRIFADGKPAAHPIRGDELRALREVQRQTSGGYVFETERGTPALN
jgi:hypothetical protein